MGHAWMVMLVWKRSSLANSNARNKGDVRINTQHYMFIVPVSGGQRFDSALSAA